MIDRQRIVDFQEKAVALDRKFRCISPGGDISQSQIGSLFLFDRYCPKQMPETHNEKESDNNKKGNDEVLFWYMIVDLYGLFIDAGEYLSFKEDKSCHVYLGSEHIKWSDSSQKKITAFFNVLNEIRSVFCHNKPMYLYPSVFDPALDQLVNGWANEAYKFLDLIDNEGKINCSASFCTFFDLFLSAAHAVLDIIEKELYSTFEKTSDDKIIFEQWFLPIARWYLNKQSIFYRARDQYILIEFNKQKNKQNNMWKAYSQAKYKVINNRTNRDETISNIIKWFPSTESSPSTDAAMRRFAKTVYYYYFSQCSNNQSKDTRFLLPDVFFRKISQEKQSDIESWTQKVESVYCPPS